MSIYEVVIFWIWIFELTYLKINIMIGKSPFDLS